MSLVLQNNEYELKAIVVHSGKFLSTGHYTAYGKRNSGTWLGSAAERDGLLFPTLRNSLVSVQ
jgi:ubiquitin C-terminal hydrolase